MSKKWHKNNSSIKFKQGSFISRIKIKENHSYIESNEPLNNTEIKALKYIEKTFNEEYIKQENEFKEWFSFILILEINEPCLNGML